MGLLDEVLVRMQRKLFPQERVLTTWSAFRLTTHRLVHEGDSWSDSLLLHQLSGSAIARQHQPLLLVLAAALLIFGLVSMNYLPGVYLPCGLLAGVCAVFYVATRRIVVRIYGDDRTLACTVRGEDVAAGREFADAVDRMACLMVRAPSVTNQLDGQSSPPL